MEHASYSPSPILNNESAYDEKKDILKVNLQNKIRPALINVEGKRV